MGGQIGMRSEEDHVRRVGALVSTHPRGEVLRPPRLTLIPIDEDERNSIHPVQLGWLVEATEIAPCRCEGVGDTRRDEELPRDEDRRQRELAA